MEVSEYITDLLVDFDEMGFAPTTLVPNPEAYAIEWRKKITNAFKELTEEKNKVFEKGAENLTRLEEAYLKLEAENLKLAEENERLREKADRNLDNLKAVLEERSENTIVADTVRKMQEEINKTLSALCKGDVSDIRRMIDQIAKEMLEGKE